MILLFFQYAMGEYVFLIFIGLQAIFILYVWFKVPETKNKTIEEITAQFRQTLWKKQKEAEKRLF